MPHETLGLLSRREKECLRLVARDRATGEIAGTLGLAVGTVENHIKNARAKLGGVDRFTAARLLAQDEGASQTLASLELSIAPAEPAATDGPSSTPVQADRDMAREPWGHFTPAPLVRPDRLQPRNTGGLDLANLTTFQRIACIVLMMIGTVIALAAFVSAFQGISQLSVWRPH